MLSALKSNAKVAAFLGLALSAVVLAPHSNVYAQNGSMGPPSANSVIYQAFYDTRATLTEGMNSVMTSVHISDQRRLKAGLLVKVDSEQMTIDSLVDNSWNEFEDDVMVVTRPSPQSHSSSADIEAIADVVSTHWASESTALLANRGRVRVRRAGSGG